MYVPLVVFSTKKQTFPIWQPITLFSCCSFLLEEEELAYETNQQHEPEGNMETENVQFNAPNDSLEGETEEEREANAL